MASKIIRLEKKKYAVTKELTEKNDPDDIVENAFMDNCEVNTGPNNFSDNSIQNIYSESCVKNPDHSNYNKKQSVAFYYDVTNDFKKFFKHLKINDLIYIISILFVSFVFYMMLKISNFYFSFYFKNIKKNK